MHLLVHLYQSQLRLHMSSLPASALLLCAYRQGADQGYAERTWKDLAYDADNRSTGIIGIKLNHDI